jgi:hypothetical protein
MVGSKIQRYRGAVVSKLPSVVAGRPRTPYLDHGPGSQEVFVGRASAHGMRCPERKHFSSNRDGRVLGSSMPAREDQSRSSPVDMRIGKRLLELRRAHNVCISDLSRWLMVTPEVICGWESGLERIPALYILSMHERWHFSLPWFFDGFDDTSSNRPHGTDMPSRLSVELRGVRHLNAQPHLPPASGWHEKPVAISVHTLLQALPADGEWTAAAGPFALLLSDLLDASTSLLEEMFDFEEGVWLVRLTPRGCAERASDEGHDIIV